MHSPRREACATCVLGATSQPCPFRPGQLRDGDVLLSQGEVADRVFYVREGVVAVSVVTRDGGEGQLALRGPGSLLGVEALRGSPSSAEARALGEVTVCSASPAAVDQWLGPADSPARTMFALVGGELNRRDEESGLRHGDALRRVARFLATHGDRDALGHVPKNVIARAVGIRAETMSRCLARLERYGFVIAAPRLRVLDAEALSALAASPESNVEELAPAPARARLLAAAASGR